MRAKRATWNEEDSRGDTEKNAKETSWNEESWPSDGPNLHGSSIGSPIFRTKGWNRGNGGNFPWRSKSRSILKSQDHTQLLFLSFYTLEWVTTGTCRSLQLPIYLSSPAIRLQATSGHSASFCSAMFLVEGLGRCLCFHTKCHSPHTSLIYWK